MIGNYGQANYAAAKAGIYGLTRVAALELQRMGITVNAVAPAALTRMTEDLALFRGASADDLGPQHITPVVVFLASDLAGDVTGQIVGVQGGKIFLYRVESTDGVEREAGSIWTPQAIHKAWDRIGA